MTTPGDDPSDPDEGWSVPRPASVPRPTFWPAALAFGITLSFWGLVTSPVMIGAGALVIAAALSGWIGEMRHEQHEG